MNEAVTFHDERHLQVGDVDFYCYGLDLAEAPEHALPVMKWPELIVRYIELCQTLQPRVIVELGVMRGGSTALLSELAHPEKLIAVELGDKAAPALTRYVAEHDLGDVVRAHYGVDQSDRARLSALLDDELGSDRIDLVVDDASHLYQPTVSSFETLFPRLRRGGLFVIEDWNADQRLADLIEHAVDKASDSERVEIEQQLQAARKERLNDTGGAESVPFTKLAVELLLARASSGDAIRDVSFDSSWIVVRRGEGVLDPETFRLADLVHDHHGFTVATR